MTHNNASIALLKNHIDTHNETARKERIISLHECLEELFSYDDELILLILENSLIDILHSRLTLRISTEGEDNLHSGSFSKFTRQIDINDSCYHGNFSTVEDASILLHEMTHAISCFAFRIDPFSFKEFIEKQSYGNSVGAQRAIKRNMEEFIESQDLPYSADQLCDEKTFSPRYYFLRDGFLGGGDNEKMSFGNCSTFFSKNLNPSKLKFNQCVREDAANIKENKYFRFPEDAFFDDLAWSFQNYLSDSKGSEEIFSVYMECRLYLLRQVKEGVISKEEGFNRLEKIAPRVHAYFEMDVIKILQHRLVYYTEKFPDEFESRYLQKYPCPESHEPKESYLPAGILKFSKS